MSDLLYAALMNTWLATRGRQKPSATQPRDNPGARDDCVASDGRREFDEPLDAISIHGARTVDERTHIGGVKSAPVAGG